MRDSALRAVEGASFLNPRFPKQSGQSAMASLIDGRDQCDPVEVANRVLYTGNPAYRRAFRKFLFEGTYTAEEASAFDEARASLVTLSNTAVPFDLDTTMAIDTAGGVNPYREAFRVVKTTSNDWRPMVSSGMVAVYVAESTAGSEAAPSFTAPTRLLQKAHTVAKFSTEIQSDYPGLEAELVKEIADAKDVLEGVQFTTGAGTTVYPQGIFTAFTSNFLDTTTTLVIVPADLYKLEAWLGPRYRANAVWLGSPYFYSLVRGIDTAGGAGLWVDNLRQGGAVGTVENRGALGYLVGHPAYEVGGLPATMATTEKVAILANRDRFVIIDRIGMNVELIPNFLSAATGYPTGERMLYAWWRNTSVGIGTATLTQGEGAAIFRGK
jgi:HK97 family phage major capsid protein